MNLAFIGTGNVSTRMSIAAQVAGHTIVEKWNYHLSPIDNVTIDADAYIICVTDDALPNVAAEIVKGREDKLFIHTAGSMSIDVFPTEHRAVMWPMQTLSKNKEIDFSQVPLIIEANNVADLQRVRELAESISNYVRTQSEEERKYMHLASVICNNFANHCYDLANEILKAHNIPFSTLIPLIDETAHKVHDMSPREAQTGPARRHDKNVIQKHIEMLHLHPEIQKIYKLLTHNIEYYDKL